MAHDQLELFPHFRPRWRAILVNSKDMSRIGELGQARQRKVDILLNKPGSATFQYPMDADYASDIQAYKAGVLFERFNWRSTLARRAGGLFGQVWDPIWSGYVLPVSEDVTNNRMTVSCVGWLQRLAKRMVREDLNYNATDDGAIIGALLHAVNKGAALPGDTTHAAGTSTFAMPDGYTIRWPAGSSPNSSTWMRWGGVQPNEGVGGATAYVAVNRNVKATKYTQVMPYYDQLINLENGCDISVDPLTRTLTVHRRYRRVKDDVVVGFQWGPHNIEQFGRELDAERKVNYFLATGEPGTTPQYAHDTADMDQVGPIEEVQALGGVRDNGVLLAFAGAEIIVRAPGVITYGISPHNYSPESGVPEPFVDYRVGDQIRATAFHAPRVAIANQACRVFGMSVSIDEDDHEHLGQLQLSP